MTKTSGEQKGFVPPASVAKNAEMGLKLRERFGRGGTDVGVRRARQLSDREEVPIEEIKKITSYFARHEVDKDSKSHEWGDESNPSAGYIAWLLWGGDAGKEWAEKTVKQAAAASGKHRGH